MQMTGALELNIAMLLLLGTAAVTDLRDRKIPNWLILTGLAFGLLLSVADSGTSGLMTSIYGFALGFALLLPGYLLRFTGAGDLKLFATLGVYTGPAILLQIFVASVLIGASLVLLQGILRHLGSSGALIWQRYRSMLQTLLTTGQCAYVPPEQGSLMSQRLPMAPIFALGTLAVFCVQMISN